MCVSWRLLVNFFLSFPEHTSPAACLLAWGRVCWTGGQDSLRGVLSSCTGGGSCFWWSPATLTLDSIWYQPLVYSWCVGTLSAKKKKTRAKKRRDHTKRSTDKYLRFQEIKNKSFESGWSEKLQWMDGDESHFENPHASTVVRVCLISARHSASVPTNMKEHSCTFSSSHLPSSHGPRWNIFPSRARSMCLFAPRRSNAAIRMHVRVVE